jgi:4-amino-4-deoxy-L-arabinose transferase-like glycosyltransferase
VDKKKTAYELVALGAFCAFLFFYGLNAFGLVGADEPRYAQVAREMLARHDWVTPYLYGQPWLEKPPLLYWGQMIGYKLWGVNEVTARLPSAVLASLMVFFIYFFHRRFRPAAALDAALIVAASAAVIGFGRGAATDMPLAAAFTIAMLCWFGWYKTQQRAWLLGYFGFAAVGMLAKGPVSPALAGLIVVVFAATRRRWELIWKTLWLPGILFFLAVAMPWYVLVQVRTPQFFRDFILNHNLARFATNLYQHHQPFWFYVPVLLLSTVPWTVFAVSGFVRAWRHAPAGEPDRDYLRYLALCVTVVFIFFSIAQSKLPGYILPGIPAMLLLAVLDIHHRAAGAQKSGWLVALHSLLAGALLVGAALAPWSVVHRHPDSTYTTIAVLIGAVLAVGIFVTVAARGVRVLRFVTLVPVVLAVAFLLRSGAPAIDAGISARGMARDLAALGMAHEKIAVFNASREIEYGLAFYRDEPVPRYGRDPVPAADHLVIGPPDYAGEIRNAAGGRRVLEIAAYPPKKVAYYWVTSAPEPH